MDGMKPWIFCDRLEENILWQNSQTGTKYGSSFTTVYLFHPPILIAYNDNIYVLL